MSEHIDFVETIYASVKNPFLFIMNRVNSTFSLATIGDGEDS